MARRLMSLSGLRVVLVDSITEIIADDAGAIVISGSHGGQSAAGFAVSIKARIYVFNDAGRGKQDAGVSGLNLLDQHAIAGCAVRHDSARIGEAVDSYESGIIGATNSSALALGIYVGMSVQRMLALMATENG